MLVLMLNNLSSNPADGFFYYFSVKISKKKFPKNASPSKCCNSSQKSWSNMDMLEKSKIWFAWLIPPASRNGNANLPTYHTSKLTTNLCRFIEWTCQSMQQSYQFIWSLWQFKESSSNFLTWSFQSIHFEMPYQFMELSWYHNYIVISVN